MSTYVIKADGNGEDFKPVKLFRSLRKAGAHKTEAQAITDRIEAEIYDGITTEAIYKHAFSLLKGQEPLGTAARYSLRRALFNLGPTGFPFEDFLSRLFNELGYNTMTGAVIKGRCVSHEIDIAAYKDDHSFVAEAKFHAQPGTKSDLQVAMYSYARFLDLKDQKICRQDICGINDFWLITNTKFTSVARDYARCVGLKLLGWDYPRGSNLHDYIQKAKIYPVTVLQSLNNQQKKHLLANDIILCRELLNNQKPLRDLRIKPKTLDAALSEARQLCSKGK